MKRRARLDYSTEYYPVTLSKKVHLEQIGDVVDGDDNPHVEGSESVEKAEEVDLDLPLREVVVVSIPSSIEVVLEEEVQQDKKSEDNRGSSILSVNEMIEQMLGRNPIQLLGDGKENQYGNFRGYYAHRCETKWSDPRVRVLRREWFLNKEVLDIGCNDGSLTLQVAIKYFPAKIVGIDIDYSLINKAVENLLLLEKQQGRCKPAVTETADIEEKEAYRRMREKLSRMPQCFLKTNTRVHAEKIEEAFLNGNAQSILSSGGGGENETIKDIKEEQDLHKIVEKEHQQLKQQSVQPEIIQQESNKAEAEVITVIQEEESIADQQKDVVRDEASNVEEGIEGKETLVGEKIIVKEEVISSVAPPANSSSQTIVSSVRILNRFPQNVRFRMENYIASTELTEKFDTICCFSTTKWIHLNFGDAGIQRLFDKVYRSLRVDGLFVLEPQEWRSYKKKQSFSQHFRDVIKSIKLHPGQFKTYLTETFPFRVEAEITPQHTSNKTPAFFKRTLYVFRKIS